jgi:hypothetical protein
MKPNQDDLPTSAVNQLRFIWLFPVTGIGLFLLVMLARLGWNQWFAEDPAARPAIRPAPKSVGGGNRTAAPSVEIPAAPAAPVRALATGVAQPMPAAEVPANPPAELSVTGIAPVPTPVPAGVPGLVGAGHRISGRARLLGVAPPEKLLPLDANCGKLYPTPPTTRFYVVGEAGGLADVFVYLASGLEGKTFSIPTQPVLLDQVACAYAPYVLGLQTRQKLVVRNSDPFLHNVHPMPAIAGNRESNRAQPPKVDLEFAFEQPELFLKFKCDVHPWMFAYVTVLDHPYFAVTDKNGAFVIPHVPPGKYAVQALHRKAQSTVQEITIGPEDREPVLQFDFTVFPPP